MNPLHRQAHGNCTAGLYRKRLTERLARAKLMEADEEAQKGISAALRTGSDHYGEQLRNLSHLSDTSPEKLRASLLFQVFKGAKAELASKSPKTLIQDLLSTIEHDNIGDNFTLELGKRLQIIADDLPSEVEKDPAVEGSISGDPSEEELPAGTSDEIATNREGSEGSPEGEQAPNYDQDEPAETEGEPEVSPDDFGDLVDKLNQ